MIRKESPAIVSQTPIRELLKDMSKYLPAQIAPAVMGLVAIPIITRLFPPDQYGVYVVVMATVSLLSIIAVNWLGTSSVRFFTAHELKVKLHELHSTLAVLSVVSIVAISLLLLGVLSLGKGYLSADYRYLMRIGLLLFIVTGCSSIFLQLLRARRLAGWYSCFSAWHVVMGLGFGIALVVLSHCGIQGLLWGAFLSLAVTLPFMWRITMKELSPKLRNFSRSLTVDMAKYGFPLAMVGLAGWILSLSDRYILEFFRGPAEVGIYSVSYSISTHSILFIGSLFTTAANPIVINIWESQGEKASQEFMSKLARYYLLICLPAVMGLSILAKPAMAVLAAQDYYQGYGVIPLVALGAFVFGVYWMFAIGLGLYKKTYLVMFCVFGSAFLNLGLNFLLIPRYGYMAAAATTLMSYTFLLATMIIMSRRYFVWEFPFISLAKAACASAVMAMPVYYLGNNLPFSALINLVVGICSGVVIYFTTLFLLREPRKEEIQKLRAIGARVLRR